VPPRGDKVNLIGRRLAGAENGFNPVPRRRKTAGKKHWGQIHGRETSFSGPLGSGECGNGSHAGVSGVAHDDRDCRPEALYPSTR
jgi:hypothetical protein